MEQEQINHLIAKQLTGEITPEEQQILTNWENMDESNKHTITTSMHIWEKSERNDKEPDVDKAWEAFAAKLNERSAIPLHAKKSNKQLYLRIAASLILVGFIGLMAGKWLLNSNNTIQTAAGEQKEITLPDGSKVWLNENSSLAYASDFENNRDIQLTGEAFFEVKRDEQHPFVITSSRTITKVLGTSFSVIDYANGEQAQLIVKTGKVSYKSVQSNKELIVLAGESAHLENGEPQMDASFQINELAWKDKRLVFADMTLKEMVPVLEKYFKIRVVIEQESILSCHFTGEFEQPKLDEVLNMLARTLQLEWKKTDNTYSISGRGCAQ